MPRRAKYATVRVAGREIKIRLVRYRFGVTQQEALTRIVRAGILRGCGEPYYLALNVSGSAGRAGANYRFALERLLRVNADLFKLGSVGSHGGYGAVYIGPGSTAPDWVKKYWHQDLDPDEKVPYCPPEED